MTMQILRKASVSIVNGLGKGGFKNVTEKRLVMRAFGNATGFEIGTTTFGDYTAFKGEFRAINEDGEESVSQKLFLVEPAEGLLKGALQANDGKPVQFGFDIFIVPDEGSERGYQYRVQNLLEIKASDPVAALANSLGAFPVAPKQPALPGTTDAPALAAPAAPVADPAPVAADPAPAAAEAAKTKKK